MEDGSYRSYLTTFVAHGGQFLRSRDKTFPDGPYGSLSYFSNYETPLSVLVEGDLGFDCIEDCLLRQVEPGIIEDLASIDAWYIGVLAHTNGVFRRVMRKHIDSYRSPFYTRGRFTSYNSFESVFGIKTIIAQVKSAPEAARIRFLQTISFSGTHKMLNQFLEAGVDVNEGGPWDDYLGSAAANGRLETFHMLLDAGANAALALPGYLRRRKWCSVPTLEHSLSTFFESTFLNSELLEHWRLHKATDTSFLEEWMLAIIRYDRPDMLDFLLSHGVELNVRTRLFNCWSAGWAMQKPCTWLILAVECGSVTCVDLLVKYGAEVAQPEGSGRTALQLAQANTCYNHPRCYFLYTDGGSPLARHVKTADDTEILAILKRALETQLESSAAMTMNLGGRNMYECVEASSQAAGKPSDSPVAICSNL